MKRRFLLSLSGEREIRNRKSKSFWRFDSRIARLRSRRVAILLTRIPTIQKIHPRSVDRPSEHRNEFRRGENFGTTETQQ